MTTVKHWYIYMAVAVTVAFLVGFFWDQNPPQPNEIPWNSNTLLEWSDFQGPVPQNSPFAAETSYLFNYSFSWRSYTSEDGCQFAITDADVVAFVDRNTSWSRPDSQSFDLLVHEQGHADILHIKAMEVAPQLWALVGILHPCPSNDSDDIEDAADQIIKAVFDPVSDSNDQMQDQYDAETDHGRNSDEQNRWNNDISDQLLPPPNPLAGLLPP